MSDPNVEQKVKELEQKVAALEGQVQEQLLDYNKRLQIFGCLNYAHYLIEEAMSLAIKPSELFSSKPTNNTSSKRNGNI